MLASFCASLCAQNADFSELPSVSAENGITTMAVNDMKYLCAGNSVYVASKLLGLNPDFSEIFKGIYSGGDAGISISEVARALERLGIANETLRLSWKEIASYRGRVFIVYEAPLPPAELGHFYVARIFDDGIQIIDPPFAVKNMNPLTHKDGARVAVIALGEGFSAPFLARTGNYFGIILLLFGLMLFLLRKKTKSWGR